MTLTANARVVDDPAARESVFAHLSRTWGIQISGYRPNFLGLHNRKWIAHTDAGDVFLKCYHPKRYSLLDAKRFEQIERSLMFQQYLHENGAPCPGLWLASDGTPVHCTPDGHYYVAMHCSAGGPAKAGAVEPLRMYRLGQATGMMHRLMPRCPLGAGEADGWKPSLPAMIESWRSNCEAAQHEPNPDARLLAAMETHGRILSRIDLSIFDGLEPGWAHWDYWVDNIMFDGDQVSGLIDFDTVKYSYPEIDVARVLLSAALDEGELNTVAAEAFLDGYREHRLFPYNRLPLAFKLLWCREAHWWLKGSTSGKDEPPRRFAEEMIWLTDRWDELDERYADW